MGSQASCVANHDLYGIPISSNALSPSNSYALKRRYSPKRAGLFTLVLIDIKAVSRRWRIYLKFKNFVRSIPMMDVVMVALAFGFFAVSIAYVYACEQL